MGLIERELCPDDPESAIRHRWYALAVRARYEWTAHDALVAKEFEAFVPMYRSRRRWSDRFKVLDLPLFPGYVFARFDDARKVSALRCPGVREIVSFGGRAAVVDCAEIEALQVVSDSRLPVEPHPYLEAGKRVRIHNGPLAGTVGIVTRIRDRDRLVLAITMLQRAISVEMRADWILPASAA